MAANVVGRAANGTAQQMGDAFLENLVLRQTDRVQESLGFEVFVHVRRGERRVTAKIEADLPFLLSFHHRLQDIAPTVGTVYVTGTKGAALQVAELVEQEKWVIAGTPEVTVVGRSLLLAMGRADA